MENTGMMVPDGVLAPSKYGTEDVFGEIAKSSSFLPYVTLYQATANLVKEKKFNMGEFGLVRSGDQVPEKLSDVFDAVILGWRPKAMSVQGVDVKAAFNPKSALFMDIQKKSADPNSGCFFGPEFLIYIPQIKTFACFLFGSITARGEAASVVARMGQAVTFKVTLRKNKKNQTWYGPVAVPCLTPFDMPEPSVIQMQLQGFNNPPEEQLEPAAPGMERDR